MRPALPARAFSLAALLLLVASLSLKAAVSDFDDRLDEAGYRRSLAVHLREQGFIALVEPRRAGFDLVHARRGACLLAARTAPTDEGLAWLRRTVKLPIVGYIHEGRFQPTFPGLGFILGEFWERAQRRLGFRRDQYVPLMIAATPACRLAAIDFGTQRLERVGK